MAFGINKRTISYLLKPYLIYVNYKKNKLRKKYKDKFLIAEDNATISSNSNIGYHVYLGDRVKVNNSDIGDHSYVNFDTVINNTTIGKFCSISSYVKFGLGYHPTHLVSTHPAFYSNNHPFKTFVNDVSFVKKERIIVGNDVWIGESATIMGGVNIGDGAIIATGAVVTKDVEPYSIVGGVPAKHIKHRIDKHLIEDIRASKWWDQKEEWLQKNHKLFTDPIQFVKHFTSDN